MRVVYARLLKLYVILEYICCAFELNIAYESFSMLNLLLGQIWGDFWMLLFQKQAITMKE